MNVLKFGGGTNSTAMAIGMWQRGIPADLILFSDTGGERPDTYAFRDLFSWWLVAHGFPPITTIQYYTKEGKHLTLEQQCHRTKSLPSITYGGRSCSQKFKIRPAHKYCRNHPDCQAAWARGERVTSLIGYDAGESRRVEHAAAETLIKVKGLGRSWSWEAYQVAYLQQAEAEARQCMLDGFADATGRCLCGSPCGCYDG